MSLPVLNSNSFISVGEVRTRNRRLAELILKRLPLPRKLAHSLAVYIDKKLTNAGISVEDARPLVQLDSSGRFRVFVNLKMIPQVLPALPSQWRVIRHNNGLEFQTSKIYSALKGRPVLTAAHMDFLGISARPKDPIIQQCCASLARALENGSLIDTRTIIEDVFYSSPSSRRLLYAALSPENGRPVSVEVPKPSFNSVWNAFKKQGINSSEHIANIIGGKVEYNSRLELGSAQWKNFCVVRLSFALNQAGSPIPFIKGKTSSGRDGTWHLFRIPDLEVYLNGLWGAPDIVIASKRGELDLSPITGKRGILHMDTSGQWKDSYGHFTLWNGQKTRDKSEEYFDVSTKVQLWELP